MRTRMSSLVKTHLNHAAYIVALIYLLEVEMSTARYMLNEEHKRLLRQKHDINSYTLGQLSRYNVVIVLLPEGSQGTISVVTIATNLI